MRSMVDEVTRYERWLRTQCAVVEADLKAKHERMRKSPFDFLRATYFRWARSIESVCPEFAGAPKVLAVGDMHVENFGTWRDADARLVWGVNDFDEAAVMPYPYDLIRLVTSARLALAAGSDPMRAAEAVLKGYMEGIGNPKPALVGQGATVKVLEAAIRREDGSSEAFWEELADCPKAKPPRGVAAALRRSLPQGATVQRFATRRKGGGSLGRPRFLVIAKWQGGRVVREAKAVVPSAWSWAHSKPGARGRFLQLAYGAQRSPDPTVALAQGFLIRRVAPDARKLDMASAAQHGVDLHILETMGADLGAIHAAHRRAPRVIDDLMQRDLDWLHEAAGKAETATRADYRAYCSGAGAR